MNLSLTDEDHNKLREIANALNAAGIGNANTYQQLVNIVSPTANEIFASLSELAKLPELQNKTHVKRRRVRRK